MVGRLFQLDCQARVSGTKQRLVYFNEDTNAGGMDNYQSVCKQDWSEWAGSYTVPRFFDSKGAATWSIDTAGRVATDGDGAGAQQAQLTSSTDPKCPGQPCARLAGMGVDAGRAVFIRLKGTTLSVAQYQGASMVGGKPVNSKRQVLQGFGWQSVDLATVTASSTWVDEGKDIKTDRAYAPDNVKKPNTNPWHSAMASKGKAQWLMFAFPQEVTMNGFRVKAHDGWDGSSFKDFHFDTSSDGKTWRTVKVGEGSNLDCCAWEEFRLKPQTSAFFRLYMLNDWGYSFLAVEQVEFSIKDDFEWQALTPMAAMLTHGTLGRDAKGRATMVGTGQPANEVAVPGKPWLSLAKTRAYLLFKFPAKVTVDGFRVRAPQGFDGSAFKDYRLERSYNGKWFSTVKAGEATNLDCCLWEEFKFLPATALYIRLTMLDNWGYSKIGIDEVQFSVKQEAACTQLSHSNNGNTQSWNYVEVPAAAQVYDAATMVTAAHLEATITQSQNCDGKVCDGHQDMFHIALTAKGKRDQKTGWYEIGIYHDNFFVRRVQGDNRWGTVAQKQYDFGFRGKGDSAEVWVKYDAATGHLWFGAGRCIGENILLDWVDPIEAKLPIDGMQVQGYVHTEVDFSVCPATDASQAACKNTAGPGLTTAGPPGKTTRPVKTPPPATTTTPTEKAYPQCVAKNVPTRSGGYAGCYANEGDGRDSGHVNVITWDLCLKKAQQQKKLFFGMEYPQTDKGVGIPWEAECLLLDAKPPMKRAADFQCEEEVNKQGHRLGDGHRLAVYETSKAGGKPAAGAGKSNTCSQAKTAQADYGYALLSQNGVFGYNCKLQAHVSATITASEAGDREDGFYIALVNKAAGRSANFGYYIIGIFANNAFIRRRVEGNKFSRDAQKNFDFKFGGVGSVAQVWFQYDATTGRLRVGSGTCIGDNTVLDWTDAVNKLPVDSVQVGKAPGTSATVRFCTGSGLAKDCLDATAQTTGPTPPPPTARPPQRQADASGGYLGCYANQGDDRDAGHTDTTHVTTWSTCRIRALQAHKPYFGLEYPQTRKNTMAWTAHCLLLDAAPSMKKVVDPQCAFEVNLQLHRLGGANRLAVYQTTEATPPPPATPAPWTRPPRTTDQNGNTAAPQPTPPPTPAPPMKTVTAPLADKCWKQLPGRKFDAGGGTGADAPACYSRADAVAACLNALDCFGITYQSPEGGACSDSGLPASSGYTISHAVQVARFVRWPDRKGELYSYSLDRLCLAGAVDVTVASTTTLGGGASGGASGSAITSKPVTGRA